MLYLGRTLSRRLRAHYEDESGAGTVFSLLMVIVVLMLGGLSIDGSNYWRNAQLMRQTADAAAHAGVVELSRGNSEADARAAALSVVNANMPPSQYGNLFEDPNTDIELLRYDEDTGALSTSGTANAVRVSLYRDDRSGNPLDTYVLRVADVLNFGLVTNLSTMNLSVDGIATVVPTKSCSSSDGVYSRQQLRLSSSSSFGPGYCLHSQSDVWMPQQNSFAPTAGISMPDLYDCGTKCDDGANPGATAASFERNFIMSDIETHILAVEASFLGTGDTTIKDEFFEGKSLESAALSALDDAGIDTSGLSRGTVVTMNQQTFEDLTDIPGGLTYHVTCSANGNGPNTRLTFDSTNGGNDLEDVAVITNCSLDFAGDADINSSVLLSTRIASSATITASSGAGIGDAIGGCDVDNKSAIMGLSDMQVPADFTGSNVSVIIDGDIHLSAASSSSTSDHSGVSFHASGKVDIAANHTFNSCNTPPSGLQPAIHVIRMIVAG